MVLVLFVPAGLADTFNMSVYILLHQPWSPHFPPIEYIQLAFDGVTLEQVAVTLGYLQMNKEVMLHNCADGGVN